MGGPDAASASSGGAPAAAAKHKHRNKGGGSALIAADTGSVADPNRFWGEVECASASRQQLIESGGDEHTMIRGWPQGNDAFRRLTVVDGDNFYGERCELGDNYRRAPTAFYHERERRITELSLRLPPGLPVDSGLFRVVMQMKQTQPSAGGGGSPMLQLQVLTGRWRLIQSAKRTLTGRSRELWSAPARTGIWTRFSLDVRYSRNPKRGFVKMRADLNGDGDYLDGFEQSRRIRTYTLKTEIPGGLRDGLKPGSSIPSHLRTGLYQDTAFSCPPPGGCSIDVDNVEVYRP